MDVMVLDKDGRPVKDLTREEGAPHDRRIFAFILDDLGTEPLHMTDGVKAVTSWLEHSADPRDEVGLHPGGRLNPTGG